MTNPMIRIHNSETDEVIDREMTNEEVAELKEMQERNTAQIAELKKAESDKAALLVKLGITADEAKLLLQ